MMCFIWLGCRGRGTSCLIWYIHGLVCRPTSFLIYLVWFWCQLVLWHIFDLFHKLSVVWYFGSGANQLYDTIYLVWFRGHQLYDTIYLVWFRGQSAVWCSQGHHVCHPRTLGQLPSPGEFHAYIFFEMESQKLTGTCLKICNLTGRYQKIN